MTISLNTIKAPVADELKEFERRFKLNMSSSIPLLDRITYYIVKRKGKQVRPLFVMLSARIFGAINESSYRAASLVELLHTATLVHDDVVDDAYQRRGFFSINALWKNKIAVLVGDYLLSKGLLLALDNDEFLLLKIVSTAVKEMSEGELMQIEKARKLDIQESVYFEIIRQKTASLIAASCSIGAASTQDDPAVVKQMWDIGEQIGIAFQIKDDLFDFGSADVGKPLGIDIKEKKMTLPLIYALQNTDARQRRKIINIIKKDSEKPEKVQEVIRFVWQSGGIEYAQERMLEHQNRALEMLEVLPRNDARIALEQLIRFVTERKK